jgi:hypothetical protein
LQILPDVTGVQTCALPIYNAVLRDRGDQRETRTLADIQHLPWRGRWR